MLVALLAGMPGAAADANPRHVANICRPPEIRLSEVAKYNLAATNSGGAPEPGAVAQTVGVNVSGGPLVVLDAPRTVTLRRTGTHASGIVRGVTVVDGRGDASGWNLALTLTGTGGRVTPARVCVQSIEATAVSTHGLRAIETRSTRLGAVVPVASAAPGTGPGAFVVTFAIATEVDARNADGIVFGLRFDITPPVRRVRPAATR